MVIQIRNLITYIGNTSIRNIERGKKVMCVSLPRVSNNIGVDIITIKRSVKKVFSFLTKGRTTLPKNFGISEYRFLIVENISTSRKTIGLANKLIIVRKANTLPQNSISFITLLFCKDNIFLVVWG